MHIEEASAKIRTGPPIDDEEGLCACRSGEGLVPIRQVVGEPVDDGRLAPGTGAPPRVTL
jgi:hypothetical protein